MPTAATLGHTGDMADSDVNNYVKRNPGRSGDWEAAGLRWLGQRAEGTELRVVEVLVREGDELHLERVRSAAPTEAAAEKFGRGLAQMHATGADAFGQGPKGWEGDGFQGPNDDLLALPLTPTERWGEFYAEVLEGLAGGFAASNRKDIDTLLGRLRDGDFDGARPAPLHGDLWSGNVMWSEDGVVLIDPAAHTGHPETDLAALQIFGTPHVERILAAYAEEAGWETGKNADWRLREPLHELQLLFLHVRLFGGSYEDQAMAAVHASLRLS